MNQVDNINSKKPPTEVISIEPYKNRKDNSRISVLDEYEILGYIAAGTYGKVYKAKKLNNSEIEFNDELKPFNQISFQQESNNHVESENVDIINQDTKKKIKTEEQIDNSADPGSNLSIEEIEINKSQSNNNQKSNESKTFNKPKRLLISEELENKILEGESFATNENNKESSKTISQLLNSKRDEIDFFTKNEPDIEQIPEINIDQEIQEIQNKIILEQSKLNAEREAKIKAKGNVPPQFYAIKKFKTEREGFEALSYIGISQSACREMSISRELNNNHLTKLVGIFLEKKSIYMVSEFAEYDLLQIIHAHSHPHKKYIETKMLKSIMWQVLDGLSYLHQNWIMHRDLKPANIMVSYDGCVKIGDLGLARKFNNLIQSLYTGDKVVVTIWYRAPELLLGVRHYTPAIDLWAVGCIFAELISLRPIFKGEEAKMDNKKTVPFQTSQFKKILEVLGTPNTQNWTNLQEYPEYYNFARFPKYEDNLQNWYNAVQGKDSYALDLLKKLLIYDPIQRIDAENALNTEYFNVQPLPSLNIFEGLNYKYPPRKIHVNDNDILGLIKDKKNLPKQQVTQMKSNIVNNAEIIRQAEEKNANNNQEDINPGMIQQKITNMNYPTQIKNNLNLLTDEQKKLYLKAENDLIKAAEKKLIAKGESQETIQHHLKLIRLRVAEETRKKILNQQGLQNKVNVDTINGVSIDSSLPVAEQFKKLSSILRASLYRLLTMFNIPYSATDTNPELMKKMEKLQPLKSQFNESQMKELSIIKLCYQKERMLKQQIQYSLNQQQQSNGMEPASKKTKM